MTPQRFSQIRELFSAVLERPAADRASFLDGACQGDEALQTEVQRLLRSHELARGFLEDSPDSKATMTVDNFNLPLDDNLNERYVIERELGRGGCGEVYLARDTHLHGKPAVIKVLQDRLDLNEWMQKKFRQECEALARINHPGVVRVLDHGRTRSGKPFLVMEFVEGVTLRTAMEAGPMEPARTAEIVRQIAQGLAAAHTEGVHHRDLKPENVILRNVGGGCEAPVIIDFGVATVRDSKVAGATSFTRIAGSYPYIAPEQLTGKPEAASDVYALGVIAYELLTGKQPFLAESPVQLYFDQRQGVAQKPSELRPGLPPEADAAVLKALLFEPAARPASPADFGEQFACALNRTPAPEPPRRRRRLAVTAITGATLLGLLAFLAFRAGISPRAPAAVPNAPSAPELSYYLLVQQFRAGKPYQKPFRPDRELLFPAGYGIQIVFRGTVPGHLYVLNEGPGQGSTPALNILFPSPGLNNGSSAVAAGRELPLPGGNNYFILDEEQGEETIWIVWAARVLPDLEELKQWANQKDRGSVKNPAQVAAVGSFLSGHVANSQVRRETDESGTRTSLRGSSDLIVHLLKLAHH